MKIIVEGPYKLVKKSPLNEIVKEVNGSLKKAITYGKQFK